MTELRQKSPSPHLYEASYAVFLLFKGGKACFVYYHINTVRIALAHQRTNTLYFYPSPPEPLFQTHHLPALLSSLKWGGDGFGVTYFFSFPKPLFTTNYSPRRALPENSIALVTSSNVNTFSLSQASREARVPQTEQQKLTIIPWQLKAACKLIWQNSLLCTITGSVLCNS